jgi:hypothetical protein
MIGQIGGKNTEGGKKEAKSVKKEAKQSDNACETSLEKPTNATVNTESDDLLIRVEANSDADIITRAAKGATVKVSCYSKQTTANGKRGRWAKVKFEGVEGWAWEAFLQF